MAIPDPRLFPFVEMLAELDMDWLAFELVEGVRRGEEPVEDESALLHARERARRASNDEEHIEPYGWDSPTAATPFSGDDQLEWAARYVEERLRAALDEVVASLDALDEIVAGGDARPSMAPAALTALVLRNGDEEHTLDRAEVEGARDRLSGLSEALAAWLRNAGSASDL